MTAADEQKSQWSGDDSSRNPLTKEFSKFVKETLQEWKIPGVSIGVVDGDQVFTEVGAGAT